LDPRLGLQLPCSPLLSAAAFDGARGQHCACRVHGTHRGFCSVASFHLHALPFRLSPSRSPLPPPPCPPPLPPHLPARVQAHAMRSPRGPRGTGDAAANTREDSVAEPDERAPPSVQHLAHWSHDAQLHVCTCGPRRAAPRSPFGGAGVWRALWGLGRSRSALSRARRKNKGGSPSETHASLLTRGPPLPCGPARAGCKRRFWSSPTARQ